MNQEELRLLEERNRRIGVAQHLSGILTVVGTTLGAAFLVLASSLIRSQLREAAAAYVKIGVLNAELEQRVNAQTRTLHSILDSIGDGLVAADAQGRFLLWNPAADRILRKTKQDIPPEEWSQHYHIYQADGVTPFPAEELPLARALHGQPASAEMFIRHDNLGKGAWIDVEASPLRDEDGAVCGGVVAFRDITDRLLADREIRRLNVDLEKRVIERTAQLEAVNRELESFTYSVSHDLRAPLRHIAGFAEILSEDYGAGLPPEAQGHLARISEGVRNLGRLTDELLKLAQMERHTLRRTPVSLNALVEEIIVILEPETQGRKVQWKISQLAEMECDPVLAKQIFQNLISNALKYSRKREQAVIEIGRTVHQDRSVIFVRDNGAGFDMKYADKLFGAFQRLHSKEDFEGVGIGLATVLRIVRKHGGEIWAEAAPDQGATFYFTLAEAEPQGQTLAAHAS
ncbi:MAG: ATP-binding protein [Candidatus Sulfotelmatobacter sp.]